MTVLDQILKLQRAQIKGVIELRGVKNLLPIYEKARLELALKLKKLIKSGMGDSFSAYHARLVMLQLRAGIRQFGGDLAGHLGTTGTLAGDLGMRHAIKSVKDLEHHFTGHMPVLQVEQASVLRGIYKGVQPSLLNRYKKSEKFYTVPVVEAVKQAMATAIITSEPVDLAVDRVVGTDGVFAAQRWRAERIVRCLPGEARVTGAVIRAAHRYWYEGAMLKIVTESGGEFTATPNHPMLTQRGWVAQDRIVKGDYLITDGRQQDAGSSGHENIAGSPPQISEVFDALAAVGVRERGRGRKPDLHGDGVEGDVNVARSHSELRIGVFTQLTKPIHKNFFTITNSRDDGFCPLCVALLPNQLACFCQRADRDAHLAQAFQDGTVSNAKGVGYFSGSFASLIASADFIQRQIQCRWREALHFFAPQYLGLLVGTRESGFLHGTLDCFGSDAGLDTRFPVAKAGPVKLDRVVRIETRNFAGHVYNLTTPYGYYCANGFYTGNTELSHSYGVTQYATMGEIQKQIPKLQRKLIETFDDRTGDDSKILHGQIRDMGDPFVYVPPFGKKGYPPFMMPPGRPLDRSVVIPWAPHWEESATTRAGGEGPGDVRAEVPRDKSL